MNDPMLPRAVRVRAVRAEIRGTVTLELDPGPAGAAFEPGQFNMLYAHGIGEVPISFSGDPRRRDALVHTIRAAGAVTRTLCAAVPGAILGVRGPFGSTWPIEAAEGDDLLIVAGGIGLAPLRPAIYRVLAGRENYNRVTIVYGARSPEELLFVDELRGWRGRFDLDVHVTVDTAGRGWHGEVGVVTELLDRLRLDADDTTALLCGPEIMMRFTAQELVDLGVPKDHIHVSLERNMKCAIGHCGRCQLGPILICRDGPVFTWEHAERLVGVREL